MNAKQQYIDNLSARLRNHFERIRDGRPTSDAKDFVGGYIQAGYDLGLISIEERDQTVAATHYEVFGMTVAERRADKALNGTETDWEAYESPAFGRKSNSRSKD